MTDRPDASTSQSTFSALLVRVWWMLFGNGALALVLITMALERERLPSWLDAAFVLLVASVIAARLVDVRYLEGRTADGARATMEHFRRHARRLLAGSAAGWGVANSLALL